MPVAATTGCCSTCVRKRNAGPWPCACLCLVASHCESQCHMTRAEQANPALNNAAEMLTHRCFQLWRRQSLRQSSRMYSTRHAPEPARMTLLLTCGLKPASAAHSPASSCGTARTAACTLQAAPPGALARWRRPRWLTGRKGNRIQCVMKETALLDWEERGHKYVCAVNEMATAALVHRKERDVF